MKLLKNYKGFSILKATDDVVFFAPSFLVGQDLASVREWYYDYETPSLESAKDEIDVLLEIEPNFLKYFQRRQARTSLRPAPGVSPSNPGEQGTTEGGAL